jgi:hypothetical protein
MKILCLLVVLANIFVFFWEYRSGAFLTKQATEQPLIEGKEAIVLVQELKKPPTPTTSTKPPKSASGIIQLQQEIENPGYSRPDQTPEPTEPQPVYETP